MELKIPVWISRLTLIYLLCLLGLSCWPEVAVAASRCSSAYTIAVTLPNQAQWDMCWEQRKREGIVLHKIYYTPPAGVRQQILSKASVAQIHVPYDDNGARFHDVSDYGLGNKSLLNLTPEECKGGTLLSFEEKNIICQQLETHSPNFRYEEDTNTDKSALTLFSVSGIGAYNYIPLWRFFDDGGIEIAMGATGALQRLGTSQQSRQGWLLDKDTIGIAHLHNFFWRLDFDLAGTPLDDFAEELNFRQSNEGMRKTSWKIRKEAARNVNPKTLRVWRVVDGALSNNKGLSSSYEIRLPESGQRDVGPASEAFTHSDIYFTRNHSCEKFASLNPTFGDCADDLARFVNNEDLENNDLVVWPSTSFYHMPRSEEAPNMDAHWSSISLTPRDWHDQNPNSSSEDTFDNTTDNPSKTAPASSTELQGGGGSLPLSILLSLSVLPIIRKLVR